MIKGLVALPACRPPSLLLRPSLSSSLLICKGAINDTATATSPSNSNPVPPIFVSLRDEDNSQPIQNSSNVKSFRLVSYNILAQSYVKSSYFPHSPSACLKWKARSQAVLKHLKDFGADFLCLQELDEFNSFYKKNMESFGYSSVYIQRTGGKKDGCGILYKKSSAEMLLSEEIHYNDLVNQVEQSGNSTTNEINNEEIDISKLEITPKLELNKKKAAIRGDPNDPKVRLKRDCVGLMAAFKLNNNINNNNLVIIANTHIYWDPEWADVKLAQVKYLLSRVSKFRENISRELSINTNKLPVIITGDFNSIPGDQVYKYITSEEESPIKLYSLYGSNGGEPKFTNYTPGFTGTLDYIFLSENIKNNNELLTAVSLLQIPGPTCEKITGGLPNCFYPSDHLPIGADFDYFLDD